MIDLAHKELLSSPLTPYLQIRDHAAGEIIFQQNQIPAGCYFVESGELAARVTDNELQRQAQLPKTFAAGEILGLTEHLQQQTHPYSAVALTPVKLSFLAKDKIAALQQDVAAKQYFVELCLNNMSRQLQQQQHAANEHSLNNANIPEVDFMVESAIAAHQQITQWPEAKIDALLMAIANEINSHAESLAQQTVLESNMGVTAHKIQKIGLGTISVAEQLTGKPGTTDLLHSGTQVEAMYTPMGVVFGMIPITNPVETIVFKCLIAIKSRNAIIVSSHRKGQGVGRRTVELIQKVLKEHGAPVNLVQAPQLPASRAVTNAFLRHDGINFILATGGPSMVKSAYQSGTPAIGVGKGNAPVWICADADLSRAAQSVVSSKSFDNGIVCGSENNLLVDASIADEFVQKAEQEGAVLLTPAELKRLLSEVFASGRLGEQFVGRSAAEICELIGVERNYPIRLILAPVAEGDIHSPLLKEKLAPVLSLSLIHDDAQALKLARDILNNEGAGHTAIIHSADKNRIRRFGETVSVSRVLVNTSGTLGCIGAANGLCLSWTLGCGTQGGGSTSDNVTYTHLLNTKRIAYNA